MPSINLNKCKQIGEYLRPIKISDPVSRIYGKTKEEKLFFALIFVGICHSINYDFLSNALAKIQRQYPEKFNPEYMEKISDEELYYWLKEYPKKERIKIETRANFVRDICKKLNKFHYGSVIDLIETSNFEVPIIYKSLDVFDAYNEDPVRKKSSCFISEILMNKIVTLKRRDLLKPQIDYHITRTILRNGLINFDSNEKNSLINFDVSDEPKTSKIRLLCIDALTEIAKHAYKDVDNIRLLYWYIGRSCCSESDPCCETCTKSECVIPRGASFRVAKCFLSSVCDSVSDKELRKIREPNFDTTFY